MVNAHAGIDLFAPHLVAAGQEEPDLLQCREFVVRHHSRSHGRSAGVSGGWSAASSAVRPSRNSRMRRAAASGSAGRAANHSSASSARPVPVWRGGDETGLRPTDLVGAGRAGAVTAPFEPLQGFCGFQFLRPGAHPPRAEAFATPDHLEPSSRSSGPGDGAGRSAGVPRHARDRTGRPRLRHPCGGGEAEAYFRFHAEVSRQLLRKRTSAIPEGTRRAARQTPAAPAQNPLTGSDPGLARRRLGGVGFTSRRGGRSTPTPQPNGSLPFTPNTR